MATNRKILFLLIYVIAWAAFLLGIRHEIIKHRDKPQVITHLTTIDSQWLIVISTGQKRCGWKYDDFGKGKYHYESKGGVSQQECVDMYLQNLHQIEAQRQKWEFISPPKRHFDFDPTSKTVKREI